ncbi:MAG: glycosyltransferase family 2 protein [Nitrospirae bacterium]|nr:glycosyltransferase family 2 protein [Magnetococcales bacterium]HAT48777.1 glycosyl transferase family 2 [Alphaproteobacteria bacterium]
MPNHYASKDIAILVPTKDRPDNMKKLLDSFVAQTQQCGRFIVVASGTSIEDVVMRYADRLNISYHHSPLSGQIRQRNMAISLLDEHTPIVGFFDDDIVLERDAVENILALWNQTGPKTAGIACNITNAPAWSPSLLKLFFGIGGMNPGKIMPSGRATSLCNVSANIQTQWLPGGVTFWRQDVIKEFHHKEIDIRRAIMEDVYFSYPIGRKYDLFVCQASRVRHEHTFVPSNQLTESSFYGLVETVMGIHFVGRHPELSFVLFTWMTLGFIMADIAKGVISRDAQILYRAKGRAQGLLLWLKERPSREETSRLLKALE